MSNLFDDLARTLAQPMLAGRALNLGAAFAIRALDELTELGLPKRSSCVNSRIRKG